MDNPETLKIVSLGLILSCVIVIVLFIIFVHEMPGKIARKRNNPQTEAIHILSLLGLLIFPLWMAALVWAYIRPFQVPVVMAAAEAPEPCSEPHHHGGGFDSPAEVRTDPSQVGDTLTEADAPSGPAREGDAVAI